MEGRQQSIFYQELNQTQFFKNERTTHFLYMINDVDVTLSGKRILQKIKLEVKRGDFFFVTGANGAGKTTLLRLLGGEITPSSGHFKMNLQFGKKTLFISKIFQDLKLINNHTLEQNLMISYDSTLYETKASFKKEMQHYCKIFNLCEFLNFKVEKVSGGVLQKVAIIRALLAQPDILLADEPTSNLDKESSVKLFEVLNYHCAKRKMAVIWATHNRDFARNFNGKTIHLEQGKLLYSGAKCFI